MDVSADLLAGLSGTKDPDDRDFCLLGGLDVAPIIAKAGVVLGGCGLIVIDAVQADPEDIHVCAPPLTGDGAVARARSCLPYDTDTGQKATPAKAHCRMEEGRCAGDACDVMFTGTRPGTTRATAQMIGFTARAGGHLCAWSGDFG